MSSIRAPHITLFAFRTLVAKDQNREHAMEDAPELIDSIHSSEHSRPPFITDVGPLTSKLPNKFQLELERARAAVSLHVLI